MPAACAFGYQNCLSGKIHFIGPDQHHGCDRQLMTEFCPLGFKWTPGRLIDGVYGTTDILMRTVSGPSAQYAD
ncbi:MAG: hypothetical protein WAO78_11975 [Roseovarius sp.]